MAAYTFPSVGLTNTYSTWVNTYSQVVTNVNLDVLRLGATVVGAAARSNTGTITANTSNTAVVGSGTRFLEELQVGDVITTSAPTQVRAITAIISNVELTVNAAFSTGVSANTYTAAGSQTTMMVSNTTVSFGDATANVAFTAVAGGASTQPYITANRDASGYVMEWIRLGAQRGRISIDSGGTFFAANLGGDTVQWYLDTNGDANLYTRNGIAFTVTGASRTAAFTGPLSWGGGSTITSSDSVAVLGDNELITGSWIFDPGAATAITTRPDAGYSHLMFQSSAGANQYSWYTTGAGGLSVYNYPAAAAWLGVSATNETTLGGTLAWGAGSAISSSSNVALLDTAQNFTANKVVLVAGVAQLDVRSTTGAVTSVGMTSDTQSSWQVGAYPTPSRFAVYNNTEATIPLEIRNGAPSYAVLIDASGLYTSGRLAAAGFATHSFSAGGTGANRVNIANTTDGTGNYSALTVEAGTNVNGGLYAYPQSFTPSVGAIANAIELAGQNVGGVSIRAVSAAGDVRLYSRNTLALTIGASQAATFTGLVSSTAFGSHSFSAAGAGGHSITVRNTSAGTSNLAAIYVGSDASATAGAIVQYSSTYSTVGWAVQDSTLLYGERPGGVSIAATDAAGDVRLYSRNALALTLGASQAAAFTGTLAWGSGSAISSSSAIPLKASNETVSGAWDFKNVTDVVRSDGNQFFRLSAESGIVTLTAGNPDSATYLDGSLAQSNNATSRTVLSWDTSANVSMPNGTLAWGGGSAISSSSNVALKDASNTFTGVAQTISAAQPSWKTLHTSATRGARFGQVLDARIDVSNNLWYDGANWNLDATGSDGWLWRGTASTPFAVELASAGTNPRTLSTLMSLSSAGTLAWGGGSAISSSSNVALLNAANVFTANQAVTRTVDGTMGAVFTNASTGASADASLALVAGSSTGGLYALSQNYTSASYYGPSMLALVSDGAGGMSIASTHASGDVRLYSRNALALTLGASQAATFSGGVVGTGATGGDKGAGTANFTAVYDDNVLLTDWVFDLHFDGHSSDPLMPEGGRLFPMAETMATAATERRLPWMPTRQAFSDDRALGKMITNLWFGQEQQQLYIAQLEQRVRDLEQRLAA